MHVVLYMIVNYRKYACALFVHNKRAMGKNVRFIKGQLISEQICGVLNFPKLQRNIARISALNSKMRKIKKTNQVFIPFCIFGKFKTPQICS